MKGDRPELHAVAKRLRDDPESDEVLYLLLQSFLEGVKKSAVRALDPDVVADSSSMVGNDHGATDESRSGSSPPRKSRSRSGRRPPRR
jgi:hypothetical protein